MLDKMKFGRLAKSVKVRYELYREELSETEEFDKRIGSGGIRIPLDRRLPLNTKLKVTIDIPDEKTISLVGEIVWQEKDQLPDKSGFDTGIQYMRIKHQDMYKITRHVIRSLRKNIASEDGIDIDTPEKKTSIRDVLQREIRLPGDNTEKVSAPDFLVHEVKLPGEKTKYAPILTGINLKFKFLDGTESEGKSLSQYISGEGVWFLVDRQLTKGSALQLTIELPHYPHPIVAVAKVVTTRGSVMYDDAEAKTYYETNALFSEISNYDRKKIIRYVYSCRTDYVIMGKTPPQGWMNKK